MATVTFIKYAKQSAGALGGVAAYVAQANKTMQENGQQLVSGQNCTPPLAVWEFLTTRAMHRKESPVWFYHYVQSFAPSEPVTGELAHEIAKMFAARAWPESEVLIATHIDREHIHSHFIVNSVCFGNGKMLRQGPGTLARLRPISDELCAAHGLSVLPRQETKMQGLGAREYRSATKGESWKFRLMNTIDECMKYAADKDAFVSLMESEGYTVRWESNRKYITYTTPDGMRCRDNKLHEEIDKTDWYRHEGFFPVIIGKQEWEQVQRLLKRQARPANGNQAKHRYAGLLTCRECGNVFIPMIRCWNGKSRVEYVCRGYHRNGKTYCSSHRIHEEVLDAAVQEYAETVRKQCAEELKKLVQLQKMWALRKPILDAHILSLQERIQNLEQEIDEIVMEKLHKNS